MKLELSDKQFKRIAKKIKGFDEADYGEYYTEQGLDANTRSEITDRIYAWLGQGEDPDDVERLSMEFLVEQVGLHPKEAKPIVQKIMDGYFENEDSWFKHEAKRIKAAPPVHTDEEIGVGDFAQDTMEGIQDYDKGPLVDRLWNAIDPVIEEYLQNYQVMGESEYQQALDTVQSAVKELALIDEIQVEE